MTDLSKRSNRYANKSGALEAWKFLNGQRTLWNEMLAVWVIIAGHRSIIERDRNGRLTDEDSAPCDDRQGQNEEGRDGSRPDEPLES